MSKNETLFKEFSPVSLKEWEEKISKDLKGKSISDIEWTTPENISLIPYYNKENDSSHFSEVPHKHKVNTKTNSWTINSFIEITSDGEANKLALKALSEGANSIIFMGEVNDLEVLLKDIMIEIIAVDFITPSPVKLAKELKKLCLDRAITFVDVEGSISFDFLGNYSKKGKWYSSKEEITDTLSQLLDQTLEADFKSITVSTAYYQHCGATIAQQIGLALAQGTEYINLLNDTFSIDELAGKIQFEFAIGNNYFLEIAKLRTFRLLWAKVINAFGGTQVTTKINTTTSTLLWSEKQVKNNMLRATSSAMSAILGGCDSLTILPFDTNSKTKKSYSDRIASNVQLILKEESYFDKVVDPSNGSYFIENLTEKLADKSWNFFQEIESKGGFIGGLESNFIQDSLHQSGEYLMDQFNSGKLTLVGVNKYETDDKKIELVRRNQSEKVDIATLSFLHLI